jgi:phosphatidylglycerol lysyltransferase
MGERLRNALPAAVGLALFVAALEVLRTELGAISWRALSANVTALPRARLALAAALTTVNYAILTGYDFLAVACVKRKLPWRRVALASFLAFAIANNVGFAALSGASVRYRFYTRWGLSAEELSLVVFSYLTTLWLGLLVLGGFSLWTLRLPDVVGGLAPAAISTIGAGLMLVGIAYVVAAAMRLRPIRVKRLVVSLPSARIAVWQLVLSVTDWIVAAAVLYVILPPHTVPFGPLVASFTGAQLLALVSHVPGGVGVFETLMVLLLRSFADSATLLPALIVFRVVYYLLPLLVALLVLVGDELRQRRSEAARLGAVFGWLSEQLTPRVLSLFTFLAGVVLLFSGATPAAAGRLSLLYRILPLGVIEASHLLGSIVGAGLLLLSQGLARRLDAAYFLSVLLIAVGISASLLKGADYEEAIVLAVVLFVLLRARPAFDRRAALLDTRFSPEWIVAVTGAVAASLWLAVFAFKHVEYTNELWWQFELHGEAPRAMRASVGAAVAVLLFAAARLVRQAPHQVTAATDAELQRAQAVIDTQTSTMPNLVYLRDKGLIFDDEGGGFVMYGVQGRSWIALGDPVGAPQRLGQLIRLFLERCDDFGGVPVFYQVGKEHLHRYADFGLTFLKLGEEALVDLNALTLEGGQWKKQRQAIKRLEKTAARFRVVAPHEVTSIMAELRAISDDWLAHHAGAEKGFSLGFFREDYVARFPIAIVEQDGRILAFANLWPGPRNVELSIDLMRFRHDAPRDVMEALMVHTILWGQQQRYQWFSLGMAPLSGFEQSPIAPLWTRLASFLYEHGDAVYNFQGLRAFKAKFHPVWQPRYLAYPGGFRLPRILADIAALVAGGYARIFLK